MSKILKESVRKGFMPVSVTGIDKGKGFTRKSKGQEERESRKYVVRKSPHRVEKVYESE